ncbi:SDR family NAD(P)-dependent oxidoreductase [Natronosalvus rutilus]|uniref:SDR family oxidoreductase n=1 Tax=Natronosalvus rutilus TaxID=2953753 RepID=A0A9E7NES2_9EURY|nr:SDR family NAD(P)-dependent oxidoreductase [Natronosalvus rutilus]UTF55655.1 SDR family oxidoreductase [Natronosalvus rutilus]
MIYNKHAHTLITAGCVVRPMPSVPNIVDGITLDDTHAIVTGAGTGIGRCIARTFASAGADVSVLDIVEQPRNESESTAEVIEQNGGTAQFVEVDLTNAHSVEDAISNAEAAFGPVEILVNNAGVNHLGSVTEVDIDEWDETVSVNLRGAFLTARFSVESLVETEGCIVNIASGAGLHGSPGYAAYGPSKAGLINLTRQLARDYSSDGVRVNAVAPGVIDAGMAGQELEDPDTIAYKEENTLLTYFGDAQDVANAVTFLASDTASFVTGETLVVDGGWDA